MWAVNGITYNIETHHSTSVTIDVLAENGYDVPRFRYHESLRVAGNCRMCPIEDANSPKPQVSCAMTISPNLDIFLNTVRVKKARESVMEFLLINHPLDRPICDQGGECDLQDLSLVYGADRGRFYDYKRNVEDKNCGLIVKTVMNRCIQCTRCVRFANDVADFNPLGITGRGMKTEIGSYIEKVINTDLSGNLVDICPVGKVIIIPCILPKGALTSKLYSFSARPWELKRIITINVLDDELQLLRADVKDNKLLRLLPAKNDYLTTIPWITDRVRLSCESLLQNKAYYQPKILNISQNWYKFSKILSELLNKIAITNFVDITLTCKNTLLSNQELLLIKSLVAYSALNYAENSTHLLYLNSSYKDIFQVEKSSKQAFCVVNLDIEYYAPLFNILLQQRNTFTTNNNFSWYSKLAHKNMSTLWGSLITLVKFLRTKSWHSVLLTDFAPTILASKNLLNKLNYFNFYTIIFKTLSDRAKTAFSVFSKVHNQNNSIQNFNINYTLHGASSIFSKEENNTITLLQSTHTNTKCNKLEFFIPVSTVYEQSNLQYFDTNYSVFKTSKTITSTLHKTAISIFKMVSTKLSKSWSKISTGSNDIWFTVKHRIFQGIAIFYNYFFCEKHYIRTLKKSYQHAHFFVRGSSDLEIKEIKYIYNNNTSCL